LYGAIAVQIARVPFIWHLRDRLASDYLHAGAIVMIRVFMRQFANLIICNSEATRATTGRHTEVWTIPSIVDPTPKVRPWRPRAVVFGMVARIAPCKGQYVFLQAFAQAFPDGDEIAMIVGAPLFG